MFSDKGSLPKSSANLLQTLYLTNEPFIEFTVQAISCQKALRGSFNTDCELTQLTGVRQSGTQSQKKAHKSV